MVERPAARSPGLGRLVAVVAAGGALGSWARYAASQVWPTPIGSFPVTTLIVNLVGCALIGVLVVCLDHRPSRSRWHELARPFLGVGVLGGFTTFSTYALDVHGLWSTGQLTAGLLLMLVTPLAAVGVTWAAVALAEHAERPA